MEALRQSREREEESVQRSLQELGIELRIEDLEWKLPGGIGSSHARLMFAKTLQKGLNNVMVQTVLEELQSKGLKPTKENVEKLFNDRTFVDKLLENMSTYLGNAVRTNNTLADNVSFAATSSTPKVASLKIKVLKNRPFILDKHYGELDVEITNPNASQYLEYTGNTPLKVSTKKKIKV